MKTSDLPDIKAVRTDFVINFVSIVIMLSVAFFVVQREYRAYILSETIADMEQQIQVAKVEDSAALELSREFREAAAHIAEAEKFHATPFSVLDFFTKITRMRPEQLIFKQASLVESPLKEGKSQVVSHRITITGEVLSLTVLDEFKGALSNWELLDKKGYALEIDETLQGRDAETGIFPYMLQINLKPKKNTPATDA